MFGDGLSIYDKEIMRIPNILTVPITIAAIAALATLVGFIAHWCGAYSPQAWGFFTLAGIMGAGILFVAFRQLYWLIFGKGDYEGRKK